MKDNPFVLGSKIAIHHQGVPLLLDVNNTFIQSFQTNYRVAIFMDVDQVGEEYWYAPSIVAKPSSIISSGGMALQFPPNTFGNYSSGDTGTIGTVKPHGWPGKAIVLNGFKAYSNDGIPWVLKTKQDC